MPEIDFGGQPRPNLKTDHASAGPICKSAGGGTRRPASVANPGRLRSCGQTGKNRDLPARDPMRRKPARRDRTDGSAPDTRPGFPAGAAAPLPTVRHRSPLPQWLQHARRLLALRPRLRAERIRAHTFEDFISGSFRTFFDFVRADQMTFATMRDNQDLQNIRIDTPEVIAGFDELRADLEVAIRNGVMPDVDADLLMAAMVGVAFEVANHLIKRDDLTVDGAAKFATALFLGGVQALPKRATAR
jgi:hypothetical protein